MTDTRFAFDLDGTVTTRELLPALAEELGLGDEMALLTRLTMDGAINFDASFRLRFALLRAVPLPVVHRIADAVPLEPHLVSFIREHSVRCAIVTGNLDVWIEPIIAKLGCAAYTSRAVIRNGAIALESILDKAEAARDMAKTGASVIAVGDAANDIPMFKAAHFSVAYAGLRTPPQGLINAADRVESDPAVLCRFLRQFI